MTQDIPCLRGRKDRQAVVGHNGEEIGPAFDLRPPVLRHVEILIQFGVFGGLHNDWCVEVRDAPYQLMNRIILEHLS